MKEFRHVSWFTTEQLNQVKKSDIIEMCEFCGNSDKRKHECQNCDIGFKKYILTEVNGIMPIL